MGGLEDIDALEEVDAEDEYGQGNNHEGSDEALLCVRQLSFGVGLII